MAWQRVVADVPLAALEAMVEEVSLDDLPKLGAASLKGQVKGRVVVAL